MNFLAHLYLSGNDEKMMIGNFIADHIKGNKFLHYDTDIQHGILLHRAIDTFTDSHPIVRISKRRLDKRYGHYGGIIIDIFYDHFLAIDWKKYSEIPLDVYINSVHELLQRNYDILPQITKEVLPDMIKNNWLYNYQFAKGIQAILNRTNDRTQGKSQMHLATEDLLNQYDLFQEDFEVFFEELRAYSNKKSKELKNTGRL